MDLPELGFGGAPIGGLLKAVDDEAPIEIVKTPLKSRIRYFDTAPFYGFGLSEHRMGEALRESKDIILSSKVGRVLKPILPENLLLTVGQDHCHFTQFLITDMMRS